MKSSKRLVRNVLIAGILACVALSADALADAQAAPATTAPALNLVGKVELPGYTGDFDHFEADVKGNRLFLAAEDHDTLEVFDLATAKHLKTLTGLVETPHGLLYLPDVNKLIVTQTGGDGLTKVIDGKSYKIVDSFKHTPGADSMAYDVARKRLYVVAGGRDMKKTDTYLVELDPYTGKNYGELKFDTDKVEAMAIEPAGNKIFINVTGKNEMAILDKKTRTVAATWPIKEAQKNAPVAFDDATRRLFIITRQPGRLIVVNADTGATVANFKAPERTDQVIFDKKTRRIFALGGEGYIGVFEEKDADHIDELPRIPSAPGAKTGILVPELNKMYVAASPGDSKAVAAILVFNVAR